VSNGEAYAHGAIDPTIAPDGKRHPGQSTIDIVTRFASYNKDLAWAFKTGEYPYDGSEEGYPNTSPEGGIVAAVISSYGDTLGDIHDFYNDLMGYGGGSVDEDGHPIPDEGYTLLGSGFGTLTSVQLLDLQTNAKNIAYYQKGDVTLNHGLPDLSNRWQSYNNWQCNDRRFDLS